MINDRRTLEERPLGYVVCTDVALSGWGLASNGRSLYALAIHDELEIDVVIENAEHRTDMKRPRYIRDLKRDGGPKVRLYAGDHLSIVDRGKAARWYEPGGFSNVEGGHHD